MALGRTGWQKSRQRGGSQLTETTQSRDRHFLRTGIVCTLMPHCNSAGWSGEVSYIELMQEASDALRADRTCCVLTSHARIHTQGCMAQKSIRKEGSWVLFARLGNLGKSLLLSGLSLAICKM